MGSLITDWWPIVIAAAVAVGGALAPWVRIWIERLIGFGFDRRMEAFRYDVRVREQAAKTAEYLALAWQLQATDNAETYRRANKLSWELALYLPSELYRDVRDGVANPEKDKNVLAALVAVRKHLLGKEAGDLDQDDILFHHPNVRRNGETLGE